jgi:hypothetical protein
MEAEVAMVVMGRREERVVTVVSVGRQVVAVSMWLVGRWIWCRVHLRATSSLAVVEGRAGRAVTLVLAVSGAKVGLVERVALVGPA